MSAKLTPVGSPVPWWITVVYGPQHDDEKVEFLNELLHFREANHGPWLLCGDFNMIYQAEDKNNDRLDRRNMRRFRALSTRHTCRRSLWLGGASLGPASVNARLLKGWIASWHRWTGLWPFRTTVSSLCLQTARTIVRCCCSSTHLMGPNGGSGLSLSAGIFRCRGPCLVAVVDQRRPFPLA
jgi:hypothetical protein